MPFVLMVLCSTLGAVGDAAVVCPSEFRSALAPWVEFREREGRHVAFLPVAADATELRGSIRRLAAGGKLRYLLLVGDAAAAGEDPTAGKGHDSRQGRRVPTAYLPARVNIRWGSEPRIATDNWYADLDDDGAPDLAVGRLTADTAEELSTLVKKILAYEQNRDFGPWRRHLHFVAGLGGFGRLTDSVLELSAKNVIAAGLPPGYSTALTQASWSSPYYPDPRRFREAAQAGLNDGCLFWIYMGHGAHRELDQIPQPVPRLRPILDAADAPGLSAAGASPIACLFSCHAGAFDGADDCLAEELLRAPGGPVAVLSGSRVTMPYAMTLLGAELLDQCFTQHQATLGDALLAAKRAVAAPAKDNSLRAGIDAMAALLSPAPADLAGERQEHLAMFNLLGDPLLGLRSPKRIELRAEVHAVAGAASGGRTETVVTIHGRAPIAGAMLIELVTPRDELRFQPQPRGSAPATAVEANECGETYARANDPVWQRKTIAIPAGEFSVTLTAAPEAHGHCRVRAFVSSKDDFALGAAEVELSTAAAPSEVSAGSARLPGKKKREARR